MSRAKRRATVAIDPLSGNNVTRLASRERERVNAENAPTYYANNIEIASSIWDFRLKCGEVLEGSEEKLVIKELATIFLSPSHAKAISILLSRKVKEYEERLKIELPLPPL